MTADDIFSYYIPLATHPRPRLPPTSLVGEILLLLLPAQLVEGVQDGQVAGPEPDVDDQRKPHVPEQTVGDTLGPGGPMQEELDHRGQQARVVLDRLEGECVGKVVTTEENVG